MSTPDEIGKISPISRKLLRPVESKREKPAQPEVAPRQQPEDQVQLGEQSRAAKVGPQFSEEVSAAKMKQFLDELHDMPDVRDDRVQQALVHLEDGYGTDVIPGLIEGLRAEGELDDL